MKEQDVPGLADYLRELGRLDATAAVELHVRSLPVGRVEVVDGVPLHAEVPGATGDRALSLLSRMRLVSAVVVEPGEKFETTVRESWRKTLSAAPPLSPAGDRLLKTMCATYRPRPGGTRPGTAPVVRLVPARSDTPKDSRAAESSAEGVGSGAPDAATPSKPSAPEPSGDRFDSTFSDAMRAYAMRDYESAEALFEECLKMRPADPRARHNLDRLAKRQGR